jgi:hypothetical protein
LKIQFKFNYYLFIKVGAPFYEIDESAPAPQGGATPAK